MTDVAFGIRVEAMALRVPPGAHPNRMPFSGVLTRVGEPSNAAPGGTGGRRILLSHAVAEAAIPSLLGMGVGVSAELDDHKPTNKVGLITAAHIDGNAVNIEGFIYAADFPHIAAEIKRRQSELGFSFEGECLPQLPRTDPLVVRRVVFTGAAILLKNAAAYRLTRIAASAEKEKQRVTEIAVPNMLLRALAAAEISTPRGANNRLTVEQVERLCAGKSTVEAMRLKLLVANAKLLPDEMRPRAI